ncbi:hypothetical protein EMPS_07499 [Entomortierella parvispora]|uniref:Uncharacterized protein n=1 Tax=Entomortierella parvispora TaxID=205924 RepID=A0A9P3HE92_9FUNG|nr:hypothetical protein EMPS_07499 [Entomortierella parvispora]
MSSPTAGLGRKKDSGMNLDRNSNSEGDSSPSLSAQASRTASTSLSSLATMRASQSSPTTNTGTGTSAPSPSQRPSLTSLASNTGSLSSRPGLSSFGASSKGISGGLGSRPSLTALARSASPAHGAQSTASGATPSRPPLSQLLANRSSTGAVGTMPSTSAALPPRRSLVGLAKVGSGSDPNSKISPNVPSSTVASTANKSEPQSGTAEPKSSPTVGLAVRSGPSLSGPSVLSGLGGLSGLARNSGLGSNGGGGLRGGLGGGIQVQSSLSGTLGSPSSPSLSGLASRSLQSRASPSLAGLSKRTESSSIATYTQDRTTDPQQAQLEDKSVAQEERDFSSPSHSDFKDDSAAYGQESNEAFATMAEQFAATSPFSTLIAKPSHFAISIFERLDPVPVPLAVETAARVASFEPSSLSRDSDTAEIAAANKIATGVSKSARTAEAEACVRAKAFQFDQPSPDDIVFKAQGSRATVIGIGNR